LLQSQGVFTAAAEEDISKHPLIRYPYNKEHEVERKRQYEKLYHRSKEQIEEEKRLIQEYKRIEAVPVLNTLCSHSVHSLLSLLSIVTHCSQYSL
jgi:hypothetical protein